MGEELWGRKILSKTNLPEENNGAEIGREEYEQGLI